MEPSGGSYTVLQDERDGGKIRPISGSSRTDRCLLETDESSLVPIGVTWCRLEDGTGREEGVRESGLPGISHLLPVITRSLLSFLSFFPLRVSVPFGTGVSVSSVSLYIGHHFINVSIFNTLGFTLIKIYRRMVSDVDLKSLVFSLHDIRQYR